MIRTFDGQLAEDFFLDKHTKATRKFASDIRRVIQRKLQYIHAAVKLQDLAVPPGNRLEALKGDLKGYHSIRINDQWRIVFKWEDNAASEVRILDYH